MKFTPGVNPDKLIFSSFLKISLLSLSVCNRIQTIFSMKQPISMTKNWKIRAKKIVLVESTPIARKLFQIPQMKVLLKSNWRLISKKLESFKF